MFGNSPAIVCRGRLIGRTIALVLNILACTSVSAIQPINSGQQRQRPCDLATLQRYLATDEILTSLPTPGQIGVEQIVAFEDHEYFAYICGESRPAGQQGDRSTISAPPDVIRRILFIRPQLIVIDDQTDLKNAGNILSRASEDTQFVKDELHFRCQSLLPQPNRAANQPADAPALWNRSLQVASFAKDREPGVPTCSIQRQGDTVSLEITENNDGAIAGRIVKLWLPDGAASGRIDIVSNDGKKLVRNRLLPAGILPPDLGAAQRRLQWDLPYQTGTHAVWDTGHASTELKRRLESGDIKPCRAVEIGCGTGSDAILLASQGFDVTAIDIAPTALNIAREKADKAGVKVNWLLADILNPPALEPFDFVYDRGCYHELRQHDPKAYVAAVEKLAHGDSKILILAGNANQDTYWRFEGPPRVKEQDIRRDFATGFRLLNLREFRFDPAAGQKQGALAWSILLERKK